MLSREERFESAAAKSSTASKSVILHLDCTKSTNFSPRGLLTRSRNIASVNSLSAAAIERANAIAEEAQSRIDGLLEHADKINGNEQKISSNAQQIGANADSIQEEARARAAAIKTEADARAKAIAEQHGGSLRAFSGGRDRGTTFRLAFP